MATTPTRTADDVLADVADAATQIEALQASIDEWYAYRTTLFHEGRALPEGKTTKAALARSARVSETAVDSALHKPDPQAAKPAALAVTP